MRELFNGCERKEKVLTPVDGRGGWPPKTGKVVVVLLKAVLSSLFVKPEDHGG